MIKKIGNLFGRSKRIPHKGGAFVPERSSTPRPPTPEPKQVFSKVFRFRLPDGETTEPSSVEIVGSFTNWKRVALNRDGRVDAWHVTIHHIPGNRTHHYMLLIDGEPTYDATCDGLVAPHGPQEERYQLITEKGPRCMMLFAQTK